MGAEAVARRESRAPAFRGPRWNRAWPLVSPGSSSPSVCSSVLPSPAAAAVERLRTSHETTTPLVPARGAGAVYATSLFGARYYRSDLGRFTTVDPAMTIKDNLVDPQPWNRYA